jgi:putative flippase GtrA
MHRLVSDSEIRKIFITGLSPNLFVLITKIRAELFRYGLVGLTSNMLLYVCYLMLSELRALTPSTAMTITYVFGVLISFSMHKQLTFRFTGARTRAFYRFLLAHVLGYLLNLSVLAWCVDKYGYPHQIVQGVAICVVAMVLFLLFKYLVFANDVTRSR